MYSLCMYSFKDAFIQGLYNLLIGYLLQCVIDLAGSDTSNILLSHMPAYIIILTFEIYYIFRVPIFKVGKDRVFCWLSYTSI